MSGGRRLELESYDPNVCPECGQTPGTDADENYDHAHKGYIVTLECQVCQATWREHHSLISVWLLPRTK